jgi:putative phage-type endonuclease
MPIIIDSYRQGDPLWFQARLGNPGASSISKIITTKGLPSKQAEELKYQLAGEIIAGKHEETYQSAHMLNGLAREAEARTLFELIEGVSVREVAIVYKDEQKKCHVSPDGLIDDNAGLEIKCPMLKTHVKYLLANKIPTEYFSQIQMSLYVCEAEYWWFMSYCPGLPELTIKVHRDEKFIEKLKKALDEFCMELITVVKKLKSLQ